MTARVIGTDDNIQVFRLLSDNYVKTSLPFDSVLSCRKNMKQLSRLKLLLKMRFFETVMPYLVCFMTGICEGIQKGQLFSF